MFKGVIFDLDGTLAYTLDDLRCAMNEMLDSFGFELCSAERILENINGGAYEFVRKSLPYKYQTDSAVIERCFNKYVECYSIHYNDTTRLYDGVADCISLLKKAGVKLGVLSNKQHMHTTAIIDKLFPANSFDVVIGQGQFPHKPDPTAALYIANSFGCRPDEMAFIGDSNVDMETAGNARMYAVGVTWGYRGVDVLLESGAMATFDNAATLAKFLSL